MESPLYKIDLSETPAQNDAFNDKGLKKAESMIAEIKCLFYLIIPMALATLAEFVPSTLSLMYVGTQFSNEILDAVGLSRTFTNITAFSMAWGMTSGLHTLVPQAIGGGNKELLALYFQRAIFVVTIFCIPLSVIQFFAGNIYILINQPRDLSNMVEDYC